MRTSNQRTSRASTLSTTPSPLASPRVPGGSVGVAVRGGAEVDVRPGVLGLADAPAVAGGGGGVGVAQTGPVTVTVAPCVRAGIVLPQTWASPISVKPMVLVPAQEVVS